MDHTEALNRILSHAAPLATDGGNGRTFRIHFDHLTATIDATILTHQYSNEDGRYLYTHYQINDLKIAT